MVASPSGHVCIIWFTDLLDRKKKTSTSREGFYSIAQDTQGRLILYAPGACGVRRAFVVFSFFELEPSIL